MDYKGKKLKLSFNSPVILGFVIICFIVLVLDKLTAGLLTRIFFSVYRSSLLDPLTYFRLFGHVIGHANRSHFFNNMLMLLIIGPLLEEKYGLKNILMLILITAFVTGIINFIFFPNVQLLGASGVVFAFILLSSMTSIKEGEIPLTFLLVAVIYFLQEMYGAIFVRDNVSNLGHIIGGIVGSVLGYLMNKNKINRY
ncbi:MAG: rhomboid family intramembrane serine protease [Tissierellia bacterium]|nr:rhomboid family intramembrane serine protease [Tissierellia bacterium]